MQTVEKLKQQVTDSSQQESKLMMRLTAKEQEIQELVVSKVLSLSISCITMWAAVYVVVLNH